MPAGTPRNPSVATAAKSMSKLAKQAGLRRLRSRVKRSVMVRQALYRPYREDRPTIDPAVAAELRLGFADEVLRLDSLLGRPVAATWQYVGSPEVVGDGARTTAGQ